mmetsp:Transcript_1220/g.1392  ORF Transcript_1220/g.1392 Transcript_1220/m.1392 type:complete len:234 (-) Transcript_1220:23-724(-)
MRKIQKFAFKILVQCDFSQPYLYNGYGCKDLWGILEGVSVISPRRLDRLTRLPTEYGISRRSALIISVNVSGVTSGIQGQTVKDVIGHDIDLSAMESYWRCNKYYIAPDQSNQFIFNLSGKNLQVDFPSFVRFMRRSVTASALSPHHPKVEFYAIAQRYVQTGSLSITLDCHVDEAVQAAKGRPHEPLWQSHLTKSAVTIKFFMFTHEDLLEYEQDHRKVKKKEIWKIARKRA